jgi:transcriptional regulator with XRE-family HTH domain
MASASRATPSDTVLRAAVRRAQAGGSSLKKLGDEIGLSAAGLLKFLRGSDPRPSTMRKLLDWYKGQPRLESEPELGTARPTFASLLPALPDEDHERLLADLAERARAVYRSRGALPPSWVVEVAGSAD